MVQLAAVKRAHHLALRIRSGDTPTAPDLDTGQEAVRASNMGNNRVRNSPSGRVGGKVTLVVMRGIMLE